jgi:adenosine/AMP kinase
MAVKLISVPIQKPQPINLIGLASCESSGPCLVPRGGTDPELAALALANADEKLRAAGRLGLDHVL